MPTAEGGGKRLRWAPHRRLGLRLQCVGVEADLVFQVSGFRVVSLGLVCERGWLAAPGVCCVACIVVACMFMKLPAAIIFRCLACLAQF